LGLGLEMGSLDVQLCVVLTEAASIQDEEEDFQYESLEWCENVISTWNMKES
jgi:hypothetical protein